MGSFTSTIDLARLADQYSSIYDAASNKTVIVYRDDNDNKGKAILVDYSGDTPVEDDTVIFESSSARYFSILNVDGKIIVAYEADSSVKYVIGTISGTSISFTTGNTIVANSCYYTSLAYDSVQEKVLVVYIFAYYVRCVVGTISGSTISFGTYSTLTDYTETVHRPSVNFDPTTGKFLLVYDDREVSGSNGVGKARALTISGELVTTGDYTQFIDTNFICISYANWSSYVGSGKFLIPYGIDSGSTYCRYATINSGSNTITIDDPIVLSTNASSGVDSVYNSTSDTVTASFQYNNVLYVYAIDVSGEAPVKLDGFSDADPVLLTTVSLTDDVNKYLIGFTQNDYYERFAVIGIDFENLISEPIPEPELSIFWTNHVDQIETEE